MKELGQIYSNSGVSTNKQTSRASIVDSDSFQQMVVQFAMHSEPKTGISEETEEPIKSASLPEKEQDESDTVQNSAEIMNEIVVEDAHDQKQSDNFFELATDSLNVALQDYLSYQPHTLTDREDVGGPQQMSHVTAQKVNGTQPIILSELTGSLSDQQMNNGILDGVSQGVENQEVENEDLSFPILAKSLGQAVGDESIQSREEQGSALSSAQRLTEQNESLLESQSSLAEPTYSMEKQLSDSSSYSHILAADVEGATTSESMVLAHDFPDVPLDQSYDQQLKMLADAQNMDEQPLVSQVLPVTKHKSDRSLDTAIKPSVETAQAMAVNQMIQPVLHTTQAMLSGQRTESAHRASDIMPFEKIVQQLTDTRSQQGNKITLQLVPEKLGSMQLTFAQHAEGSRLEFAFEQPQTKDLVLSIKHELEQVLHKQGQEGFLVRESVPVSNERVLQPQASFISSSFSGSEGQQQRFMQQQQESKNNNHYMVAEEETILEQPTHVISILA